MRFFRNLSIRTKLFLVSVIPCLGLILLLYSAISESLEKKDSALQVYSECEEVERLSTLLNSLQLERGWYLSYLADRNERYRANISEQTRQSSDAAVAVRDIFLSHGKRSELLLSFDSLDRFRRDTVNYPEKLNEIKNRILDEISSVAQLSRNPDIKNLLAAHLSLLSTKEYFSRTKNVLLPFLIDKDFSGYEYVGFIARKGQYDLSRTRFLKSASPALLDTYNRLVSGDAINNVHALLDSVIVNSRHLRIATARDWWDKSMLVVNAYAEVEKFSLSQIRQKAESEVAAMNNSVLINVAAGIIALLLIATLVSLTIRHIIFSIEELKKAAQKLARGEVDFSVNVTSKDEMGDLAESFSKMVAINKQYAENAEKIGNGNYDTPVMVRSDFDILGMALNDMKDALARLSKENETRTWMLTGSNRLNDRMRGEKSLPVLANEIITQLSETLEGQVGALYIRENGHLKLSGTYAYHADEQDIVNVGDGLVGQAAADGKKIVFDDIPDDYLKIHSGLGASKPRNIVVYPFRYEGEVAGVLEIGSTREFSALALEFLDLIDNHVGIAINGAQSREKLKQLLEETQRQSEELETQQEELRQFNEELLEKTRLLEKSEEELKSQQEELQLSNEELVEKAALLEDQKQNLEFTKLQMEAKARELELASQYKSEFLSNMSHELRTPLNSILILAQVLVENRSKTLSEKEIKFANTIYNSGNDLLSLINEILDLSKIEAGKMELEINAFSLVELTQKITSSFEELGRSKKVKFAVRCPAALQQKVMVSDMPRIEQVLKNFLANAFKFTSQGGKIELLVSKADEQVVFRRPSLQKATDVLSFTVTDTGIGIPEDKLGIIFEAFQQVDGSTKRQYGGTGLGLSISRELTKLLGGEIHVTSELGKGSTFTLFLPAELPGQEAREGESTVTIYPEKAPQLPAVGKVAFPVSDASHYDDQHLITADDRTILIMEDDEEFAKILLSFVHERNYKGIIAHKGNVGLSYARHYKPDAIILDMKLPVVDGSEVLKKLKSDPELRHIPVQIISGYDFRKSGLALGAIDFIQKPVSREAFWKALDKVEYFVSRKPKKLLIVEDDVQHNQAVKELIGNGDVKCYSAYSGMEAYNLLSAEGFDCIIVDLGLPDMTGFAFLEKIRENKDMNRIPVIVYTGKDLSKEENARLEKLADTVVLKTAFSNDRLLDETTLFLHRVESNLPKEKQHIIRKLHKTDEVLRNRKVLIVDDDDRNVYSLLSALEHEGLQCYQASNGKEALAVINEKKDIDLVLMDVMMPEMDGFEATRIIRTMPDYKKLPIIALTAKAMKDDREKCLAAGMSDYISKPLNIQQLLSLMRVWLYA